MKATGLATVAWVGFVLANTGCTTTQLKQSWVAPGGHPPIEKVLVIGVAKTQATRRIFEDTFVEKLEAAGKQAVASYTLLASSEKLDKEQIEKAATDAGADAVIITRYVGKNQKTVEYPPTRFGSTSYYGPMYNYYSWSFDNMYSPGYTETYEVHTLESNLYDGKNEKLIWTATTETTETDEPIEIHAEVKALVDILIRDLKTKNLI